jgi:hypothetical protein
MGSIMLVEMTSCPFCHKGENSPCFAIYDDGHKCFSCGSFKKYSFDYKPINKKEQVAIDGKTVPTGSVTMKSFPIDIQKWLLKYYVTDATVREFRITDVGSNKLMFPIVDEAGIIYYQVRSFPSKFILATGENPFSVFTSKLRSDAVVVVEDYISAVRVNEHTSSLCLFGTNLPSAVVAKLLQTYDNLVVWLDGDEAGVKASNKIKEIAERQIEINNKKFPFKLQNNKKCIIIKTEEDPKCYSPSEIKRILKENLDEYKY